MQQTIHKLTFDATQHQGQGRENQKAKNIRHPNEILKKREKRKKNHKSVPKQLVRV